MRVIGKWGSSDSRGNEFKLYFQVENAEKVHPEISPYLNGGLFIEFSGGVKFKGYIENESSKGHRMTMFLVIFIEAEKMSALFALKDQDIYLDLKIDSSSSITKQGVNWKFLAKIKHIIKILGDEVGHTYFDMRKILENNFAAKIEAPRFNMLNAEPGQIGIFYDYIVEQAAEVDIIIPSDNPNRFAGDVYLKTRRSMGLCCVCTAPIDKLNGIYPLCKKHNKEMEDLKINHKIAWEKMFKKAHKLE